MKKQLALDVHLKDFRTFDNFIVGDNAEAVKKMHDIIAAASGGLIYLWGATGCGKTHLLQAACRLADDTTRPPAYIPLSEANNLSPDILTGVARSDFICIDDIDSIAGLGEWERALFALYELRGQTPLIVTAKANPRSIDLKMPDLMTRLANGLVYQIEPLSDDKKIKALQLRASQRGIELADDVGKYILNRFPRDTHALFGLLDKLDKASLATQRKITIPFVQEMEAIK